jgi:MFS family permease
MSEEKIIMEYIHNNKIYHRSLLLIGCMIWGFSDIIALSLGLLELKPEIEIRNANGDVTYRGNLEYSDCDKDYTIISMNKHSLTNYFGIYCNKYLVAMIASSGFMGVFLGTVVAPYIYDNYGRRKPIIIASMFNSFIILLSTLSRNIYEMYIFIFFYGFSNLISHLAIFILISEVTHKSHRATSSMVVFNSFSLFGIIFSLSLNIWKIGKLYLELILYVL